MIEAGRLVTQRLGRPIEVDYKDKKRADPVTEVDRAVEAYLTAAVAARFPDHAVLGEEGQDPEGDPEFQWIVDPVDGTVNFINRLPLYAISIGVLHRRRPVVGVILFPASGELLHARRGGGAYRNGERVHVSEPPELRPTLLGGLPLGFGWQFRVGRDARRKMGEARSLGSIAYEMGMVATGSLGYAVFRGPKIWDVAGGVTLVREAGGEVFRYSRARGGWVPLRSFDVPPKRGKKEPPALRTWKQPVIAGTRPALEVLTPHLRPCRAPFNIFAYLKKRYLGWRKKDKR